MQDMTWPLLYPVDANLGARYVEGVQGGKFNRLKTWFYTPILKILDLLVDFASFKITYVRLNSWFTENFFIF